MANIANSQTNSKKLINYSAIIGDNKISVNDKSKGRNIQNFYLKKTPTNNILLEKMDKAVLLSKSNIPIEKLFLNKSIEKKRLIQQSGLDINKLDTTNNNSFNTHSNKNQNPSIMNAKDQTVSLSKIISEKMKDKVKLLKNLKNGDERMRKRLIDNNEAKKLFNQSNNTSTVDAKNNSVMFQTNPSIGVSFKIIKKGKIFIFILR